MTSMVRARSSNARTATIAALVALAMLGLGFASVPLYRLFCQVTGYGGTTQRATEEQATLAANGGKLAARRVSVRFDSNISSGLPWAFYPEKKVMTVGVGGKALAIFVARNLTDHPVKGRAVFNVTPEQAGPYFNKIQCFCFTEQTLQPGQEVRMPVVFFVDSKMLEDPDARDIQQITLSYTFYPVEQPDQGS